VLFSSANTGSPGTPKRWERTQSEVYLKGRALPTNVMESALFLDNGASSGSDSSISDGGTKMSEHTKVCAQYIINWLFKFYIRLYDRYPTTL